MPSELQPQTKPAVVDEEYKDAIQPVVDDRMRTDILGPHFCRVLKDHKPASKDIVALMWGTCQSITSFFACGSLA